MIDFPRAWQIARMIPPTAHDENCSFRQASGGFLCDCDIIYRNAEFLDKRNMYGEDGEVVRTYDENGVPSDVLPKPLRFAKDNL